MVDLILHIVVNVVFGFLIGAVVSVFNLVSEPREAKIRKQLNLPEKDEFPGSVRDFFDQADKNAEVSRRLVADPIVRSLTIACLGIVVMFIILVRYTTVTMYWKVFFLGLVTGMLVFVIPTLKTKLGSKRDKRLAAGQ